MFPRQIGFDHLLAFKTGDEAVFRQFRQQFGKEFIRQQLRQFEQLEQQFKQLK